MYSPRSRWRRSARALALLRWTSRSLRQAIYSDEPTATLLARQKVSSSSLSVFATVGGPRSRQPPSSGAASRSAANGGMAVIFGFMRCLPYLMVRSPVPRGVSDHEAPIVPLILRDACKHAPQDEVQRNAAYSRRTSSHPA